MYRYLSKSVTDVVAAAAFARAAVLGPEACDHAYFEIVPSGSFELLPFKLVLLVGLSRLTSVPAFAVGAWFVGAEFTVTATASVAVAPALSVTVSVKLYVP
jgi:hypothetical protein